MLGRPAKFAAARVHVGAAVADIEVAHPRGDTGVEGVVVADTLLAPLIQVALGPSHTS
jgi:hypothetical protein